MIVSKEYVDNINKIVRENTNIKQWRKTEVVVLWLKNTENNSLFIKFDIVDFYTSMLKELLLEAVNFAKSKKSIDDKFIKTILHARK